MFCLKAIDVPLPWINAIVPAIAFMLSTIALPFQEALGKIWLWMLLFELVKVFFEVDNFFVFYRYAFFLQENDLDILAF